MLYPQKKTAKGADNIIKITVFSAIIIGIILIIINNLTTPQIRWARYCNAGIIYVLASVFYSLSKNVNIARQLFFQMIAISVFCVYIDVTTGFKAWSINIAIPIIIIVTNVTMLILSITSYDYIRYAFFQFLIIIVSLVPMFLMYENIINDKTLSIVATSISLSNLLISLICHFKEIKTELVRRFHV